MVIDACEAQILEGQGAQALDQQGFGLCGRQFPAVDAVEEVADLGGVMTERSCGHQRVRSFD